MFFYLLHQLPWGQTMEDGKRNVRIMVIGLLLYYVIYFIILNVYINSFIFLHVRNMIWFMFFWDICIMSWVYKNHFGRTIISELGTNENYVYEADKHQYRKKTELDKNIEVEEIYDNLTKIIVEKETKEKMKNIIETKEKINSAKKIQNWWKHKSN